MRHLIKAANATWFSHETKYLSVHIRHHTGKNPYKFGQCDMAITNQTILTVHLRPQTWMESLSIQPM